MPVDHNATRYEFGNGRFDLMTDEEVRTLDSDDMQGILVRLAHLCDEGESSIGEDLYHRLYELHVRYPNHRFRLEATEIEDVPEGESE